MWFPCVCRCQSKWNYHWSLVCNGDFSKLNRGDDDDDETKKPKIKFKIIPPPPKDKPEAPLPPPPKKAPSPRPPRPKRRVEVDVFRLCWRDSWMSLKPPKYLYLKAKEQEIKIPGFTTITLAITREYKPQEHHLGAEWACPAQRWTRCWKQVRQGLMRCCPVNAPSGCPGWSFMKPPWYFYTPSSVLSHFCSQVRHLLRSEVSEEKHWETLLERQEACKPQIGHFTLPVWAGTWKIMNFAFRQEKPKWDGVWPDYEQTISNKSGKIEELEEEVRRTFSRVSYFVSRHSFVVIAQEEPSNWEDSWKLSGVELDLEDTTVADVLPSAEATAEINEVFMPGWSNSWQLAASPGEAEEQHRNWSVCWSFRQQMR